MSQNVRAPGEVKKRTEDKLARMEITNSGMVLKKQTKTSNKKPANLFRINSAADLLRFSQICESPGDMLSSEGRQNATTTYNVFGIGCQSNVCALWMLLAKDMCHDVSICNRSHGCKAIAFRFTGINLLTIILDRLFRAFKFCAGEREIDITRSNQATHV